MEVVKIVSRVELYYWVPNLVSWEKSCKTAFFPAMNAGWLPGAKGLKQIYLKDKLKTFLFGSGFTHLYYFRWLARLVFTYAVQFLK